MVQRRSQAHSRRCKSCACVRDARFEGQVRIYDDDMPTILRPEDAARRWSHQPRPRRRRVWRVGRTDKPA